jgi:membrane-bound inhibitor of C-type lysozyme
MRTVAVSSLLVLCLFATGCQKKENAAAAPGAASEAAAPAPAPTPTPAPAAAESEAAMPPVSEPAPGASAAPTVNNGHDYTCDDGAKLNAKVENGTIVLTVDGKAQTLKPTEGAYGANYSGDGLTFIAQGDHAMLARDGQKPSNCTAQ